MNKQQLAQKIWASANQMRSKIEANEYKDYILGFIFYKYLSDKEVKFLKENDYDDELLKTVSEEDDETVKWVQENIGYFIAYKDLFSTWLSMGKDFDVSNVRDALSAFSRLISNTHKKVFDKVFDTLQTGLSKLGDSSGSQTKAISGLLTLIKDIPMDGKQDYDVLGFIYEYLISNFAANAGKKAGEFYTPHEVSLLKMSNIRDEDGGLNASDIEIINGKRLVFIVDEAHRSTFGDMLSIIKETFPNAIFFGFTGTPVFEENAKKNNAQTDVFGNELHRYSIADGIRDKNVLGFDPYKVLTFRDKDVRKVVALEKAKAATEEEAISDPKKAKIFYEYMDSSTVKMAGFLGDDGKWVKGIEDYLENKDIDLVMRSLSGLS